MGLLKLPPAPTRETLVVDSRGASLKLFPGWLQWFTQLWSVIDTVLPSVSDDAGDNDITLTVGTSERTQMFLSPLTAPRTVTLATKNAHNGASFRIVRATTSTGASALNVNGIKALATGEWADFEMSNSGWQLTASGSL